MIRKNKLVGLHSEIVPCRRQRQGATTTTAIFQTKQQLQLLLQNTRPMWNRSAYQIISNVRPRTTTTIAVNSHHILGKLSLEQSAATAERIDSSTRICPTHESVRQFTSSSTNERMFPTRFVSTTNTTTKMTTTITTRGGFIHSSSRVNPYLSLRMASSSSSGGVQRKSTTTSNTTSTTSNILANEDLIITLRNQFPQASGPTEIQVRLVIDEVGEDIPSTVMICSLADAIQISLDRNIDLIGVAMKNDPPVIRAVRLSKLEYQKELLASAKQKSISKKKQAMKTIRFRAGIDTHDLERKIQSIIKCLEQGIDCEYTVFSKARTLRDNSSAGEELVTKIQSMIGNVGIPKKPPKANDEGNQIRVYLVPKKA